MRRAYPHRGCGSVNPLNLALYWHRCSGGQASRAC